jgi:hypothetical protein
LLAVSTGLQRSSRLISMKAANGMLCLPQAAGHVEAGTVRVVRGVHCAVGGVRCARCALCCQRCALCAVCTLLSAVRAVRGVHCAVGGVRCARCALCAVCTVL